MPHGTGPVSTILVLLLTLGGAATANWSETFDGGAFDLGTWLFTSYPELTGTFEATIQDGPGDEGHLSLDETSAADGGGSQFGIGIGNPDDVFTDVRVGATFNVRGDASRNYYVLVIHYEDGPANMRIELVKAVNLSDEIMETWQPEVPVPGVDHARSHYVELDVVGSDPNRAGQSRQPQRRDHGSVAAGSAGARRRSCQEPLRRAGRGRFRPRLHHGQHLRISRRALAGANPDLCRYQRQ